MVLTLGHWKTSRSSAVVNRRFVGHAIAPTRKHAYRATAISGLFGMWRTARSPWRTPRATKARDSSACQQISINPQNVIEDEGSPVGTRPRPVETRRSWESLHFLCIFFPD